MAYVNNIKLWEKLYSGEVPWAKYYKAGLRNGNLERKTLRTTYAVSHKLAKLIWSVQPIISVGEQNQSYLEDVFNRSSFYVKMYEYLEYMAALGGFAIKLVVNDGEIDLDFIYPTNFTIVSMKNNKVYEADFTYREKVGNDVYTRIESHRITDGNYIIASSFYKNSAKVTKESTVFANYSGDIVIENFSTPMFVYLKNPLANNIDPLSSYGVSIIANSLDTLECIDEAYDALRVEIQVGRTKTYIPSKFLKTEYDLESGESQKRMDYYNTAYEVFTSDDSSDDKIVVSNPQLRVEELNKALNIHLGALASQIGFSVDELLVGSYDTSGVKTATEVMADNSESFREKSSYTNMIHDSIYDLILTIFSIEDWLLDGDTLRYLDIGIQWSDSLVDDDDSKAERASKLIASKLMSRKTILVNMYGYTEEEALKELLAIAEEEKLFSGEVVEVTQE